MATTFRSTTGANQAPGFGQTSLPIPKPPGVVAGDLLVAIVGTIGGFPSLPAGWTKWATGAASSTLHAYRVAGTAEPASYSFPLGGDVDAAIDMVAYYGQHPTSPIDTDAATNTSSTSPINSPARTANYPGGLVVRTVICRNGGQTRDVALPAGTVYRAAAAGGGNPGGMRLGIADAPQGVSLAVPAAAWVPSGSVSVYNNVGGTLVIRTANVAPNAPTLKSPVGGVALDRAVTQRFAWTFSDPNAGDLQSKYDLRYRPVGGVYTTLTGTTPNVFRDMPGGTFPAGDFEWSVRTYDQQGAVGPYSASGFFTAADMPAGPTILAPINNGAVSASQAVVQWSYPDQQEYQVRTVADLDGAPDPGVIYSDTGLVVDTETRQVLVAFPVNNRAEHVQVRVRDELLSPWTSSRVTVSYTAPAAPMLAVTGSNADATFTVAITNPAPTAGQPAVTAHDLYRREGGVGEGERIAAGLAPGSTYVDRTPGHGMDYTYRAVSVGNNGTSTTGLWSDLTAARYDVTPLGTAVFG